MMVERQRGFPSTRPAKLGLSLWLLGGCGCPITGTVGGLLAKPPIAEREVVCVRAVYRGALRCEPCPPDALCQPCMPVVLLAEAADSPDDQVIWVFGVADALVAGRAYTFRLRLLPGFDEQLRTQGNNPIYFDGPPSVELLSARD